MAHVSGILFDFTFKADTPQPILDLFKFLGTCGDYLFNDGGPEKQQFLQLLDQCPDSFVTELSQTNEIGTDTLKKLLFEYTTQTYAYMHGWDIRRFNEETRRFESAASHRYVFADEVIEILEALRPYLVLEPGTIIARELYESSQQEEVYYYVGRTICRGNGFFYRGGEDENVLHPNFCQRERGWALNEGFKPPMNYHDLTKQGLDLLTNQLGYKSWEDQLMDGETQ